MSKDEEDKGNMDEGDGIKEKKIEKQKVKKREKSNKYREKEKFVCYEI